jgi:hypothetical protein
MVIQSEEFYSQPNRVLSEVTSWLDLPPVSLVGGDDRNSHRYRPMDQGMRRQLIEMYREPNEQLYDLLGRRFDWLH